MKSVVLFLLTLTLAFAVDSDLDGVDDSIDLCPNSSFDTIVNRYGCKKKIGINLSLGGSFSVGTYGTTQDYVTRTTDMYISYKKANWRFSSALSYVSSGTLNSSITDINNTNSGLADTYVYGGYVLKFGNHKSKSFMLQALVKFPTADAGFGSGEMDYGVNMNYASIHGRFSYYIQAGYLVLTDTATTNYSNVLSSALGCGVSLGKFYTSLSYNYATPYIKGDNESQSIGLSTSYSLSRSWYISLSYSKGLSAAVADDRASATLTTSF